MLDARLPDGSGIDVCREVRSNDPGIACLILTSYDDDEALFAAIMAGARATCSSRSAAPTSSTRSAGSPPGSRCSTRRSPRGCWTGCGRARPQDERLAGLTDQERRILELIAEGLTNRQIGERMFLAEKTVKNYVSSMLSKLGMERRTQAAVFATKLGT